MAHQQAAIVAACRGLRPLLDEHDLVITHGNGPQVGLLAFQAAAYQPANDITFDVLGAQTEGMTSRRCRRVDFRDRAVSSVAVG